jgi:hypothetical protein
VEASSSAYFWPPHPSLGVCASPVVVDCTSHYARCRLWLLLFHPPYHPHAATVAAAVLDVPATLAQSHHGPQVQKTVAL